LPTLPHTTEALETVAEPFARARPRRKVCRLQTRCRNEGELLRLLSRLVSEGTLFLPAALAVERGHRLRFVVDMADGRPALAGQGTVIDAMARGPGGRRGPRIEIESISPETRALYEKLASAGRAPAVTSGATLQVVSGDSQDEFTADPTRKSGPPAALQMMLSDLNRDVPAEPGALPANPFGAIDLDTLELFVECSLVEQAHAAPLLDEVPGGPGLDALAAERRAAIAEPAPDGRSTPVVNAVAAPLRSDVAAPEPEGSLVTAQSVHGRALEPPPGPAAPRSQGFWGAFMGTVVVMALAAGGLYFLATKGILRLGVAVDPSGSPEGRSAPGRLMIVPAGAAAAQPAAVSVPEAAQSACAAQVRSDPAGAEVFLGGRRLGTTPLVTGFDLPCGDATFVIRGGGAEAEATVSLARDHPGEVSVRLRRSMAQIHVTSDPANATVFVDGRKVGRAPAAAEIGLGETVLVQAKLPGWKTWSKRMRANDPTIELDARLTRATTEPPRANFQVAPVDPF
jgi:hypothetical protein